MASNLSDFLGLNDLSQVRKEISVKVGDKVLSIIVRPLTNEEHGDFQKRCINIVKGKSSLDIQKYNNLTLEACVVEPNFSDPDFLKKAGCVSAIEFFNKKLPAGTIMDISSEIQKLSGFESLEVEVEEAKN